MATIKAKPKNIQKKVRRLRAGDTLLLKKGCYASPVFCDGLGGTATAPITIRSEGKAVFCGGECFDTARSRINKLAYRRQKAGYYPSIGQTADESWLILRNCRYVTIENLRFEACWPGAIYIDDSQHITVRKVHFKEGTIAIGANGGSTRDLLIEDCCWQQDVTEDNIMWNTDSWDKIHGQELGDDREKQELKSVNVEEDYRLWDGDFFRAWEIPGDVVIRRNTIKDAFNAIHLFNRKHHLKRTNDETGDEVAGAPNGAANILIEDNIFIRVRDNVIEPEEAAWNWVVRHNAFLDCYRWFSFEMQFGGHIYVYGNVGWDDKLPVGKSGGSVLKLSAGTTIGVGPFYLFHNSWLLKDRIVSKNAIRNFYMFNNAVDFTTSNPPKVFGKRSIIKKEGEFLAALHKEHNFDHSSLHDDRFTARWTELNNFCDGDIVNHADFPELYNSVGMKFGKNCRSESPGFANEKNEENPFKAFATELDKDSIPFTLETPYGAVMEIPSGHALRGAVQVDGRKYQLPKEFGWIETDSKAMLVSKDDSGEGKKPKPA